LNLNDKGLNNIPKSITNLRDLRYLFLENNHLTSLPDTIGNLTNLCYLNIGGNQIDCLPESIINLSKLNGLWLVGNPLKDFSILQKLPSLQFVRFIGDGSFYHRYWAGFDDWYPLWLSDREKENNRILQITLERNYGDEA
jgi:Leucine rich repeat